MPKRYISLWFRSLLTDWKTIRQPDLKDTAFVFAEPDHGRKVITALTALAKSYGVKEGMTIADAQVIAPNLDVFDDKKDRNLKLLKGLAEWCLRYTPLVAVDPPDGLLLDATGCTHLHGTEAAYLNDIIQRLKIIGYHVQPGMADTIGCAWAVARYTPADPIVAPAAHRLALLPLPAAALRLSYDVLVKLNQLGLYHVSSFVHMPKSVLRRRFGNGMVLRMSQALGQEEEYLLPLKEPVPYSERLSCLEPIRTRVAIEHALQTLLEQMCKRLYGEGLGAREAIMTWYRIDGKNGNIVVGTNHPSHRAEHLFKLFALKLDTVAPGLGIELFTLDVSKTEPVTDKQNDFWASKPALDSEPIAELLDRMAGRVGTVNIKRYLPADHFWPERTIDVSTSIKQQPLSDWRTGKPRPMQMLAIPEMIEAMALTPDYPPKMFTYRGKQHVIVNADGPERIEREWWLDPGEHRDYYIVEDNYGGRYWLFRSGHYDPESPQHWFIHGFFA